MTLQALTRNAESVLLPMALAGQVGVFLVHPTWMLAVAIGLVLTSILCSRALDDRRREAKLMDEVEAQKHEVKRQKELLGEALTAKKRPGTF